MVRFCQTIGRGEAGGAGGKWASRQPPGVGEQGCRGKSSQQAPPSSVTLHLSLLNIFPLESPVGLYSGQWNSSAFSTEYHKRERSLWFIWKKSSRRTPLQAGEKKPHLGPGRLLRNCRSPRVPKFPRWRSLLARAAREARNSSAKPRFLRHVREGQACTFRGRQVHRGPQGWGWEVAGARVPERSRACAPTAARAPPRTVPFLKAAVTFVPSRALPLQPQ